MFNIHITKKLTKHFCKMYIQVYTTSKIQNTTYSNYCLCLLIIFLLT